MSKRIRYSNEPIKIGHSVGGAILPRERTSQTGSGPSSSEKKRMTLRLPPKLIEKVRREAKRAEETMSDYVARKLRQAGC